MGVINDITQWIKPSKALPFPQQDGSAPINVRGGRYGEMVNQSVLPGNLVHGEEGSYFSLTNPTLGTGVVYALQTSFSDTAAAFVFQNEHSIGDPKAKRVYIDFIKLILGVATAPTATVSLHMVVKLDNIARTPSAGSRNDFPVNCNMDDGTQSKCRIYQFAAGAMTVPASGGQARTVVRTAIPTGLGINGDSYIFKFGGGQDLTGRNPLTAVRATDVATMVSNSPQPLIIGPGQSAVVHLYWLTAATTAPSFEYELGIIER